MYYNSEYISYDDEVFILEELGFAVFEDGTVKWWCEENCITQQL